MNAPALSQPLRSLRRVQIFGVFLIVFVLGGALVWSIFAQITGAVIASAVLSVESNAKPIQHRDGGTILDVPVREGDLVTLGDVLVVLDDTELRTAVQSYRSQLLELVALRSRLVAERDGVPVFATDTGGLDLGPQSAVSEVFDNQRTLLTANLSSRAQIASQLRVQITQIREQIGGLRAQLAANSEQLALARNELASMSALLDKELVTESRVLNLRREIIGLQGTAGGLAAQIAQLGGKISETNLRLVQLEEEARSRILSELANARSRSATLREQFTAARARLARTRILAPQAGYVHQLRVFAKGAVAAPGDTLMLIVPSRDALIVKARIAPVDVDQVHVGQDARVTISAFSSRTTPDLRAEVTRVGADSSFDQASGAVFFDADLEINTDDLSGFGHDLKPGMQAEVFISRDRRSAISFLIKPLLDQISHAMRE